MIGGGHDFQIFNPVVCLVLIDVMDVKSIGNRAALAQPNGTVQILATLLMARLEVPVRLRIVENAVISDRNDLRGLISARATLLEPPISRVEVFPISVAGDNVPSLINWPAIISSEENAVNESLLPASLRTVKPALFP